jgi:hypothetical protein
MGDDYIHTLMACRPDAGSGQDTVNDRPRTAALLDTQCLAVPLALNKTSIRSGHFRLSHIPVLMKTI